MEEDYSVITVLSDGVIQQQVFLGKSLFKVFRVLLFGLIAYNRPGKPGGGYNRAGEPGVPLQSFIISFVSNFQGG